MVSWRIPHSFLMVIFLAGLLPHFTTACSLGCVPLPVGSIRRTISIVGLSNRRDSCDEQHYVNPIQFCGNVGVCLINVESRQSENFLLLWCFSTSSDFQKSCKNSLIVYFITVILSLTNSSAYVKYSSMVAQWLTQ